MRICDNHPGPDGQSGAYGFGFWSFIPCVFGFNGWFYAYADSYPAALWRWLTSGE